MLCILASRVQVSATPTATFFQMVPWYVAGASWGLLVLLFSVSQAQYYRHVSLYLAKGNINCFFKTLNIYYFKSFIPFPYVNSRIYNGNKPYNLTMTTHTIAMLNDMFYV